MSDVSPRRKAAACVAGFAALLTFPIAAHAQLRVATWNISNYDGSDRTTALKTAVYGQFSGRSMAPDVFMTQEFMSQTAVDSFLSILNTATNSPGDWAAATFVNGADTDSAFFYRTTKVNFVSDTKILTGGSGTTPPRDVHRYDVTLKGYTGTAPILSMYSVHMKAGDSGSGASGDEGRRQTEANAIRANAEALGHAFLVGGDFNTPSSSDAGFARLVESRPNNVGRFVDPINTPGNWASDSAFKFVHTQDPSGAAGMNDRYDHILLGTSLTNGSGFDYIGNPNVAYSTTTWDDPNHSYRAYGNDGGQALNAKIRTTGNTMVGPTVAQALIDASTTNGGHLPILLDLRAPGELATTAAATISFGTVAQGSGATQSISIFNDVNTAIWGAGGIAELLYSLQSTTGFSVPSGTFSDLAGGGSNSHLITLDTSTLGLKTGTLSLFDNGVLARTINLTATVVPEPGSVALLGIGVMRLIARRRRGA